jgi:hypothetical protein
VSFLKQFEEWAVLQSKRPRTRVAAAINRITGPMKCVVSLVEVVGLIEKKRFTGDLSKM